MFKKLGLSLLSFIMVLSFMISGSNVIAATEENIQSQVIKTSNIHVWGNIFLTPYQYRIWNELRSDFEVINNVDVENEFLFIQENRMWIDAVNGRFEYFLSTVNEELHDTLIDLLSGLNPLMRTGQMSHYFTSHTRHRRNGFTTYTLRPTLSTRTLRPTARRALDVLYVRQWSLRSNYTTANVNSLTNQFWCHFDFDFETLFFGGTWDLEVERPDVGLLRTIAAFCNPD